MKTKKEMKISRASIVFYVTSIIFLTIAAFEIYRAYLAVESYKTTYTLQLADILNLYLTGYVLCFGFAFLAYGIGEVLKKINDLTSTLRLYIENVIEEEVEEETEEFVSEPVANEMKNARYQAKLQLAKRMPKLYRLSGYRFFYYPILLSEVTHIIVQKIFCQLMDFFCILLFTVTCEIYFKLKTER